MKYISECDLIVYDLHSGNPLDVKLALDALSVPKGEDEAAGDEKVLILISSLLAWDNTPKKLTEVRDPVEIEAEEKKVAKRMAERIAQEKERIRAERAANKILKTKAEGEKDDDDDVLSEGIEEPIVLGYLEPEPLPIRRHKKYLHSAFSEMDY